MNEKVLSRQQIREKGMTALRTNLGIRGFIQFLQDFGINKGNYTKEKEELFRDKTVEDLARDLKK